MHLDGDLGRPGSGLGMGPTLGHLLPAGLQSQADTMGRPHVRLLGEETHSLWTERSGQDIYNSLKGKKKAWAATPSFPKHFRNVVQHTQLFKYPNPE